MKWIAICGLILLLPFVGQGQSTGPYTLSLRKDIPLLTAGLGIGLGGFLLDRSTTPLTQAEVDALDINDVPQFDRYSTRQNSAGSARASDVLFYGATLAPFGMLVNSSARKDWLTLGVMYTETFLLNTGLTLGTKGLVLRPRPFQFNPAVDNAEKLTRSGRHSFYSGHTSTAAAFPFLRPKYGQITILIRN